MVLKFLGPFYILMSVECFLGPALLVPNIPHFILLSAHSGHFSRELSKFAVSTQSFHCTPFKPFGPGKPAWFFGSLKFFKPGKPISEGACWFGTFTHALEGAFFTRSPHTLYLGSPCVTPTVRCIVWRSATRGWWAWSKQQKNQRPENSTRQLIPIIRNGFKRYGQERKDEGNGGGSIISERLYVKELRMSVKEVCVCVTKL